jgi:hypothetical protein
MTFSEGRLYLNLKKLKNLIFLSIVICGLIIPTSAFASNSTVQSASNTGISQAISNFFSMFDKSTTSGSVQNTTINSSNYSSMNSSDLFDCFWNWLSKGNNNGESNSGGTKDDDGQCQTEDCNFGNNNGCLSSADVWKDWYCKF